MNPNVNTVRKHLVIVAYSFLPGSNSEGRVGWEFASRLSNYFEVTVIVSEHYCERLRKVILPNNLNVEFHSLKKLELLRLSNNVLFSTMYYNLWIKSIPKMLKIKGIKPDIVQHLTFVRFTTPSKLWEMGVPTVLGPVGGAEYVPLKFYKKFKWKFKLIEMLRYWNIRSSNFWFSGARASIKNADVIFAVTEDTAKQCKKVNKDAKVIVYSQLGMSDEELELTQMSKKTHTNFRIIAVGRMIYWKGFDILTDAFKKIAKDDMELILVGDGTIRKDLENKTQDLHNVKFLGHLTREEVFMEYTNSDVFCLPSLHDSGGFVFLEALACKLPVICMDVGGPGLYVDETCGVKVPVTNRESAVEGIAEAILKLYKDKDLLENLSVGTQAIVENYKWDNKIKRMIDELETLCD